MLMKTNGEKQTIRMIKNMKSCTSRMTISAGEKSIYLSKTLSLTIVIKKWKSIQQKIILLTNSLWRTKANNYLIGKGGITENGSRVKQYLSVVIKGNDLTNSKSLASLSSSEIIETKRRISLKLFKDKKSKTKILTINILQPVK